MKGLTDPGNLLEVESRTHYAARPGFRIAEFTISAKQKIPWHCHSNIQDTFYVVAGQLRIFLRDPKEEVHLGPGQTYAVRAKRPHLVANGCETLTTFIICKASANTTSSR